MTTPDRQATRGALITCLSRLQLDLLREWPPSGENAIVRSFQGAVLLADLSGFSPLTWQYEQKGKAGAEELASILRRYFGKLAEIVLSYGGDVIGFAGDAALAVWLAADETSIGDQVRLSHQAALAIHQALVCDLELHQGVLELRSAIAAGRLHAAHLGGVSGRWEFLLAGPPLLEAGAAINQIARGRLAIGESARKWTEPGSSAMGAAGLAQVDPTGLAVDAPLQRTAAPQIPIEIDLDPFVPTFVAERLLAGMTGWLSEFRNITAVFAGFPGFTETSAEALAGLQPLVRTVQELLNRYEGSLYQFLMDDKGLVLIAIFGLPGQTHEDDAVRAVQAAKAIHAAGAAQGTNIALGVATGSSFCGVYGFDARRQYASLGTAMNAAARLMQSATEGVLCDEPTALQAQRSGELRFEQAGPLVVKGHHSPILAYRPVAVVQKLASDSNSRAMRPLETGMVGRARERAALAAGLDALQKNRQRGLIVLEGQPGIGKSRLIGHALRHATDLGLSWLGGAGQAIETATPYHAWRPVFATVFGLSNSTESLPRRQQRVLKYLRQAPELAAVAPLLNVVLPIDLAENETTAELHGEARAERTRQLLLRVLEMYSADEPLVLVLDDAHWFDSVSWTLARMAAERLPAVLCVLGIRPSPDMPAGEYEEMLKLPSTQRFRLDALSPQDALELACLRLGVTSMMQPIADYVLRQTEGTPLFVEELIYAMRDCGAIEVAGAECRLGPRMADTSRSFEHLFSELRLPGTVQGIIVSRIDRLPEPEQLLIKVASVIGYQFTLAELAGIYPVEAGRENLLAMAERLVSFDLLRCGADGVYEFRHALIQEVVYDRIPFASRKEIHRSVAEWYERTQTGNLHSDYSLLGHHWSCAEDVPKAIEYLSLAGARALSSFAYIEAVRLFSETIHLDRDHPEWSGKDGKHMRLLRAQWEFQIGSACVAWCKYADAREHLERGLTLAGRALPKSKLSALLLLLGQIARQTAIRLRRPKPSALNEEERESLLEIARAYEGLMEIYFYVDRPLLCLYSVFSGLNLAEKAGPSGELARCYSSIAALMGFMNLSKWTRTYFRLAQVTAAKAAEAGAEAWVAMVQSVYDVGQGNRAAAREQFLHSLAIYDRLGDLRHGDSTRINFAASCHLHGAFAESMELAAHVYSSALLRRDGRIRAEALRWRVYNLLVLGRLEETQTAITELDQLRSNTMNLGGIFKKQDVLTQSGLLYLRRRNYSAALEAASAALRETQSLSDSPELLVERAGIAEVFLGCWDSGGVDRTDVEAKAAAAVKGLGRYAARFPIGKPAFLYFEGRLLALRGFDARALKSWEQTCATAASLDTAMYEALAHREIGRLLPAEDPLRQSHLDRARVLFEKLGMESVTSLLPAPTVVMQR